MFRKAKEYMLEINADFVFTGEVLNERPMSQNRDTLNLIEKESGLKGKLLRPLSAKCLDITDPENENLIDRANLLDIKGRSRKIQFELAGKYDLKQFPTPAGGCLLTDKEFSRRLKVVFDKKIDKKIDFNLLKYGRFFILSNYAILILGRNEKENNMILDIASDDHLKITVKDVKSSFGVIVNSENGTDVENAASICARYSKIENTLDMVSVYTWYKDSEKKVINVKPFSTEESHKFII